MENISAFQGIALNPTFDMFEQLPNFNNTSYFLYWSYNTQRVLGQWQPGLVGWGEWCLLVWAPGWGSTFQSRMQNVQRDTGKKCDHFFQLSLFLFERSTSEHLYLENVYDFVFFSTRVFLSFHERESVHGNSEIFQVTNQREV